MKSKSRLLLMLFLGFSVTAAAAAAAPKKTLADSPKTKAEAVKLEEPTAATEQTPKLEAPPEARWKEYGRNVLTAKVGTTTSSLGLSVEDRKGAGHEIDFTPNVPTSYFLALSYDWLAARIAIPATLSSEDARAKGYTEADDWQLRLNFRQLSLDLFYQNYQGYYVENSDAFQAVPGTYLRQPQLRNEHIGAGLIWNFSPDSFSLPASYDQTAEQLSSGWAWLAGASFHTNRFSNPTTLVPMSQAVDYGAFTDVRSARLNSLMVGGGLGGSYVFWPHWFLTGLVMAYTGIDQSRVEKVTGESVDSHMPTKSIVKGSIGYNGPRYLYGISAQADAANYFVENATMRFTTQSVAVYFGAHVEL